MASSGLVPSMDAKRFFGEQVKRLRIDAGLSQEGLAMAIGADQAYVSRIESGQSNPTLETLLLIADALNAPPNVFLPGKSSPPSAP